MRKLFLQCGGWLSLFFGLAEVCLAVGENNPTGVTGDYNGSVATAGSYDPFTGNAKRVVTDLTVTGSVGAYPLKWTRTLNTRGGSGWAGSYGWSLWTRVNGPGFSDNQYEGPQGEIDYPDGRRMTLVNADTDVWMIQNPGHEPMDRLQHMGNGDYDLIMRDGGRVRFVADGPPVTGFTSFTVTAIIDPYGQMTTLQYDGLHRFSRIVEPAGRYLEITWDRFYGYDSRSWSDLPIYVRAYDGRGNLMETVAYHYDPQDAQGIVNVRFWNLTRVDYDDGGHAYYTYYDPEQANNSPWSLSPGLIEACQDDRFAGPMKRIKYEYMVRSSAQPQIAWGQIKAEKNFSGETVSEMQYPANVPWPYTDPGTRTEHRPDGALRTFQYSEVEISGYTDFLNHWSQISYAAVPGSNHYLQIFTDARQKTTVTEKEGVAGAVVKITPPGAYSTRYTYSDPNNPYYLASKTVEREDQPGPGGYTTNYQWETVAGKTHIRQITYPDQSTEYFTYNDFGQVLTHTLVSGGVENFRYDNRGLKTVSWPPVTDGDANPDLHPTQYFYYQSGPHTDRLQRVIDPRGNTTWYEYDLGGRVTKVTHQDGTFIQSSYNPDGTLAWSADENHPNASTNVAERTRYIYDEYKRVLTATNPMGEITEYGYALDQGWLHPLWHTTGSLKFVVSPLSKNVVFDYDANFRKRFETKAMQTADQAVTQFEYDEVGNLVKTTDPRGKITTFGYDDRNRQTSVTNALSETTRFEYDAANNKTKEIQHDNSFRSWKYDSMNQLVEAHDWRTNEPPAANQTTYYWHNLTNTTRTITDTKGAIYTFQYDAMNRKTAANYPGDSTLTTRAEYFYYDIGGNLSLYRNPAGQYKHLNFADSYDSRNRLRHSAWTASRYSMVVDWNIGQEIFTNYDAASRMTSITTNNGATTVAFGYDAANRKVWEDQTLGGYPTRRVDTPRDADGNRHALQVSTLYYIEYAYTLRNQLASIGNFANFTYDASGNMTSRLQTWLYNNGTNFAYDDLSRVSQIELGDNSHIFSTRHYQYDTVNREKLTWRDEDNGFGTGRGERFEYDPTNQLKKVYYEAQNVWATNPANAVNTQEYSYTADRLNRASVSNNGVVTSYVMPNGMNQYTTVGGQGVSYDARFNIAGYNGMTFAYDAQNRLVGGSMQATYDGLGRCVKRTINGQTRLFTYDEWNPILEWDQSGNWLAWNVYGARPDEILARNDATHGALIYKQDHHGNVVTLLSWSGVVEKYTYDAFGKPKVMNPAGTELAGTSYGNRFLFQGREYIAELGVYDYRHRVYHPGLGRFLQTDPTGFDAGDMNLFRYCGDDPIDGTDPTGLVNTGAGTTLEERLNLFYGPGTNVGGLYDLNRSNSFNLSMGQMAEVSRDGIPVTGGFKNRREMEDYAVSKDYAQIDKSGIGRKDRPEYGGLSLERKDVHGKSEYGFTGPYKGKQGRVEDKYRKMREANYLVVHGPGSLPVPDGWTKIGWHYAHVIPGNTIPADDKAVARDHNYHVVGAAPPLKRTIYYNPRMPAVDYYP